jgi:hypothetical protein
MRRLDDEPGPSAQQVARPLPIRSSTRTPGSSNDHIGVTVAMRWQTERRARVDEVSFVGTTRMAAAATPTTNDGYRYGMLAVIEDQINRPPNCHATPDLPSNVWLVLAHVQG